MKFLTYLETFAPLWNFHSCPPVCIIGLISNHSFMWSAFKCDVFESFIACNACLKYTCNSSAWCNVLFEQSLCLHNLVRYFNFSFNITFENSLIWCNNRGWINDYKLPHPSGSEATPNYNISSTILCCWYWIFPLKNSLWFVQNCGHTTLSLIHLSGAHYSKSSWSSCPLPNFVVTLMFF